MRLIPFIISFISLSLFIHPLIGQGEPLYPLSNLPAVYPSYIKNLSRDENTDLICLKDVVEGKDGRIWINPCGMSNAYFSLHLLQYDGFSVQSVDLGRQDLLMNAATTFSGVGEDGEIIGFIIDKTSNIVFTIDQVTFEVTYFDFSFVKEEDFQVRNAIPDKNGGLLVIGSGNVSIQLFSVKKDQIRLLTQVPVQVKKNSFFRNRPLVLEAPILQTEKGIWFMDEFFPIFFYEIESGNLIEMDPYQQLGAEVWDHLREPEFQFYSSARMFEEEEGILFFHPSYAPYFFEVDRPGGNISVLDDFPASWRSMGINADEKGNHMFLLTDENDRRRAILKDTSNQLYDFSSFLINVDDRMFGIFGKDFFQHFFVSVPNNLLSAGVKQSKGIQVMDFDAYLDPWLTYMDDHFIAYDNDKVLNFIQTNKDRNLLIKTKVPESPCLKRIANSTTEIKSFISTPDGTHWMINKDSILMYRPANQACRVIPIGKELELLSVMDENTLLYLTEDRQLFQFNTQTLESDLIIDAPYIRGKLFALHFASDATLWTATSDGLWKTNLGTKKSELIGYEKPFADFRFQSILEDEKGILWLGSFFGGVHRYNPRNGAVKVINEEQGLADDKIMSMIQDEEGDIWVASSMGLSLLDQEGNVLTNLSPEDGLHSNGFRRFGASRSPDGKIMFASSKGLNLIDPNIIKARIARQNPGSVFITSLSYFDKKQGREITERGVIEPNKKIYLPPGQSYLRVRMALSNYIHPEKNHFAYKMEGKDLDWTYVGNQHELFLNHLPSGDYQLLIKGADYQNNWSDTPFVLRISAGEFFYKKPWFYILLFCIAGLFAFLQIRRLQTQKIRLEQEVNKRTEQIRKDKEMIAQQAEELLKLDELKSRFFTNISHELRTPITLITAPVEQLIRNSAGQLEKGMKKSLQLVLNNGRRLTRLVEELLDLSKLEANKLELKETPTPLSVFCRQIFNNFQGQAEIAQIDYQFHVNGLESEWYWIDRPRLEKIVSNLLSNALKFTDKGGLVALRLFKEEGTIRIEVEDTGRGISPEDLPNIFERYFQTKDSKAPREGGTGIGLAMSHELTQLMQGKLDVKSEQGQGSTFTLSLPLKSAIPGKAEQVSVLTNQSAEASSPVLQREEKNGVPNPKPSLLIVEDNLDMQQLLVSLLEEEYHCQIANNGAEALDKLRQAEASKEPELIISDIMMPRMDGYTLLEHLKKDRAHQKTPVIMLTSKSADEHKLKALRLGVDDYLTKPFSPEELQLRVRKLIANAQERKVFIRTSPPDDSIPAGADEMWLQKLEQVSQLALDKQLDLSKSYLADQMALSERHLLRRLKSLTGLTIQQYTLEVKLQRARRLLENRTYATIAEVAYASGFNSPGYFSRTYEKHFGKRPSRA